MKEKPRRICRVLRALVVLACALAPSAARADVFTPKLVRRFDGSHHFEEQGLTVVRSAGDLTGDGVPDLIAGLKTLPLPGNQVSARIYSGADGVLLQSIPWVPHLDSSPNPVAGLDDLDGDGLPEFIVGTPAAGVARIYSAGGGLLGTLAEPPASKFGASVSRAGDTNLDGIQDLLIGAPGANSVHVHSGNPAPPTPFPLIAVITGPDDARFGASVAHFDAPLPPGARRLPSRIVVGAPLAVNPTGGGGHNGCVHVLQLNPSAPGTALQLFSSFGQGSFDLLGSDVDGGVDVDGDAFEDYLGSAIAADLPVPQGTGQLGRGYVTLFSGRNGQPLRTFQSDQIGDLFGFAARFGGPCGAEPTVIIGAPRAVRQEPDGSMKITGRVLLHTLGLAGPLAEVHGESKFAGMGIGVGGYVDVTGDGRAEFLAGSHGAHSSGPPGLFGSGSVFVLSCVDIPRPAIAAVPAPVLFVNTEVGGTVNTTLTISNVGQADLHVGAPSFTPATSPAFSFAGPNGPMTIAPANSQALPLQFMPGTPGIHGGLLEIQSDDPCTPLLTIGLGGKALLKKILVDPGVVDFGPVEVGEGTGTVIAVKNDGNLPLTVSGVSLPAGDFGIGFLPNFPKGLSPGEEFLFVAFFQPSVQGPAGASIEVASDDPVNPVVSVPLGGSGTQPNPAPTAVIAMDVPYSKFGANILIPFRGDQSFDTSPFPPAQVLQFFWQFAGFGSSTNVNQVFSFPCGLGPCIEVTRLTVTDSGGKSDPTSISMISLGERPVRSRFYGRIQQGGFDVPPGTVVEAWINAVKVASALTQVHHGESVYAIEVPPDIGGPGGTEHDTVEFRYRSATANETGTWYSATDQELDLTAPFYVSPFLLVPWCVTVFNHDLCGPPSIIPDQGLQLEFEIKPIPLPDPPPLRLVGEPFSLQFLSGVGGPPITRFTEDYQIAVRYSDRELEALGITNEETLALHVLEGESWLRAGLSSVDAGANEVVTSLNHASTFALLGEGSSLPRGRRMPGDCTQDGTIDISDPICLLSYLFIGTIERLPCGTGSRADPGNVALMDWNGDGQINLSDAVAALSFLFAGGDPHGGGRQCVEIAGCTELCP